MLGSLLNRTSGGDTERALLPSLLSLRTEFLELEFIFAVCGKIDVLFKKKLKYWLNAFWITTQI